MTWTAQSYSPPCWYTPEGHKKVVCRMRQRGLPSFKDWRFLTLTVDPADFPDAETAYVELKEKLRFLMRDLRKLYGGFRYCWKLEFQGNGWPHWHLLMEIRHKVDLDFIRRKWHWGRIDVQRVTHHDMDYIQKYVTKGFELPDWVLDFPQRIRFFQTSRDFYEQQNPNWDIPEEKDEEEEPEPMPQESIRQKLEKWSHVVVMRSADGQFRTVKLTCTYIALYYKMSAHSILIGRQLVGCDCRIINLKTTKDIERWQQKLLNPNNRQITLPLSALGTDCN